MFKMVDMIKIVLLRLIFLYLINDYGYNGIVLGD